MTDTTCLTADYCGENEVISGVDGDVVPVLDDDDTDIDFDDDINIITNRGTTKYCMHSRPCAICTYLTLSVLLLGSVVALVVVGVMVISPYRRVAHYKTTDCYVANISWANGHRQCSCGKSCSSMYPCLTVVVILPNLHTSLTNDVSASSIGNQNGAPNVEYENQTIVMHEDETLLDKSVSRE